MKATPLGAFLTLRLDREKVSADAVYDIVGVRSFGRGLFARGPLEGSHTSYKHFNRLSAGQLVLSRLKGWEGALALVHGEHDGRYVSTEFPTFDIDTSVADPTFVEYVCKWPDLWGRLGGAARGVGARRTRVKEGEFLNVEIPLPNLTRQRMIGDRLGAVDTSADAAQECVKAVRGRTLILLESLVQRPDLSDSEKNRRGWQRFRLHEFLTLDIDAVPVEDDEIYPMAGVYSFGRGLFSRDPVVGGETSYKKYHRLRVGQIVLSRLFGWEGAIARVTPVHDGLFVSTEFPTFSVDESVARPDFIEALVSTEVFWGKLRGEAAGVGVRRQRVSAARFLAQEVWLPPLDMQGSAADHLVALRHLVQDESRGEMLEALVPSAINATFADFS